MNSCKGPCRPVHAHPLLGLVVSLTVNGLTANSGYGTPESLTLNR